MIFALKTDVGQVRDENQDSCAAFEYDGAVFAVVADGMGGHSGGSVASSIATECFEKLIKDEYKAFLKDTKLIELLKSCANAANMEIYEKAMRNDELEGMGTTLVMAAIRDSKAIVLNVGDSRAYICTERGIERISKDQSYVQQLVDKGEISEDEAKNHPRKNIIMQAVGTTPSVRPDIYEIECGSGYILLCSDGLSNMIDDDGIRDILLTRDEIEKKTEKLIWTANEAGGEDNITAVLIEI